MFQIHVTLQVILMACLAYVEFREQVLNFGRTSQLRLQLQAYPCLLEGLHVSFCSSLTANNGIKATFAVLLWVHPLRAEGLIEIELINPIYQ